jgi:hypothetical protein
LQHLGLLLIMNYRGKYWYIYIYTYIYIFYSASFKQDFKLMLPVVLYSSINSEKPIESSNHYGPSSVHDRFRVCRSLKHHGVHVQTWVQHAKKFHSLSTLVQKGNRVSDVHLSEYTMSLMQDIAVYGIV